METGATQLPSRRDVRKLFSYETVWVGNSLHLNKNFGTNRCGLCAKERYLILKFSDCLRDTSKLINSIKCENFNSLLRQVFLYSRTTINVELFSAIRCLRSTTNDLIKTCLKKACLERSRRIKVQTKKTSASVASIVDNLLLND